MLYKAGRRKFKKVKLRETSPTILTFTMNLNATTILIKEMIRLQWGEIQLYALYQKKNF